MTHGSKTQDEFVARMRDAGYEDWEIQEELAEQKEVKSLIDSFQNGRNTSLHCEAKYACKASEQLNKENGIQSVKKDMEIR